MQTLKCGACKNSHHMQISHVCGSHLHVVRATYVVYMDSEFFLSFFFGRWRGQCTYTLANIQKYLPCAELTHM